MSSSIPNSTFHTFPRPHELLLAAQMDQDKSTPEPGHHASITATMLMLDLVKASLAKIGLAIFLSCSVVLRLTYGHR